MSEEALKEKDAAIAGEGLSPHVSRISLAGTAALSGRSIAGSAGSPVSHRSMAGAVHRVSLGSISPVVSDRHLQTEFSDSDDMPVCKSSDFKSCEPEFSLLLASRCNCTGSPSTIHETTRVS